MKFTWRGMSFDYQNGIMNFLPRRLLRKFCTRRQLARARRLVLTRLSRCRVIHQAAHAVADGRHAQPFPASGTHGDTRLAFLQKMVKTDRLAGWRGSGATSLTDLLGDSLLIAGFPVNYCDVLHKCNSLIFTWGDSICLLPSDIASPQTP